MILISLPLLWLSRALEKKRKIARGRHLQNLQNQVDEIGTGATGENKDG
jgi:hypothetical protein